MRRFAPVLGHQLPDRFEVRFRIDDEDRHVDHVVEGAARGFQDGVQVVEGAPHLRFQLRFRRAVFAAADLSRHEQEAVGANGWRIAVAVIERLAPRWKNDVA
ncbi:hypothetical protein D3C72_2256770 [compost metagenome]